MKRPRSPEQDPSILEGRMEDAERRAFDLEEDRSQTGPAAAELLQAQAVAHQERVALRASFEALARTLDSAARSSQAIEGGQKPPLEELERILVLAHEDRPVGWAFGRRYLMTRLKADAHMTGVSSNPVVDWYLREIVRSPIFSARLLAKGPVGDAARADLVEYLEEHGLRVGLENSWRRFVRPDHSSSR